MKAGRVGGLLLFGLLIVGAIGSHSSPQSSTSTDVAAEPQVTAEEAFDERARKAATDLLAHSSLREVHDHILAAAFITLYKQHCALGKKLPESTLGIARGITLIRGDEVSAQVEEWDSNRRIVGDLNFCRKIEDGKLKKLVGN
jgi:hypothetical protein